MDNSVRQVVTSGPHRYSFQTAVSYRCNPGYYLLGTSSISCQGDGTWDRSLPKCLRECSAAAFISFSHFGIGRLVPFEKTLDKVAADKGVERERGRGRRRTVWKKKKVIDSWQLCNFLEFLCRVVML